jgi:hypothetical protein
MNKRLEGNAPLTLKALTDLLATENSEESMNRLKSQGCTNAKLSERRGSPHSAMLDLC